MDQFDQLILTAVAAFMCGLVGAGLSMWLLMDRRLQKEHSNTMRAMDLSARMQMRTPVSYIGREEDAADEKEQDDLRERMQIERGEAYVSEVGEENPNTDDGTPAGMEG